jgi:hypothetical protein
MRPDVTNQKIGTRAQSEFRRTSMRFSAFLATISAVLFALTPASFDEDRD